jgi:uncharacterized short protein YbdD (DUF466 family)
MATRPAVSMTLPRRGAGTGAGFTRSRVARCARALWGWLREVSGDAAYERYLAAQHRAGSRKQLTEREFYVDRLRRRYSTTSRCC